MRFIITAFLVSQPFLCFSQETGSGPAMLRDGYHADEKAHYHEYAKGTKNEVQMLFGGLFLFYKTFISSQDGNRCGFTPSCSEYGMLAVKKKGVLAGILATLDRLQRCHPLEKSTYETDPDSGLMIDHP